MHFKKWYYSTWFIAFLFAFGFLIVPLILGVILLLKQKKESEDYFHSWEVDKKQILYKLQEELLEEVLQQELTSKAHLKEEVDTQHLNIERLNLLSTLKNIAMNREMEYFKKQQIKIAQDIKEQCEMELENEIRAKKKEFERLNLLSVLKNVAMNHEIESFKEQQNKIVLDIKNQCKIELENEVRSKQKEIARLNLLSTLKKVAMNREIKCFIKQQNKIAQDIKEQCEMELENEVRAKQKEIEEHNRIINRKIHQLNRLNRIKRYYKKEIVVLKDEVLYQSFGFYDLRYDLEDSQKYKEMLEKVRLDQKEAVKNGLSVEYYNHWRLNNSRRQGEAMNNKNIKMTIRSFNNECDAVIHKVKFNNVEASEKKIRKARLQIDKLNKYNAIKITDYYLDLKLEELYLAYEYAEKKQKEKEERRRQNELLREENRVRQEIEARRKILLKEEQHYRQALVKYLNQLKKNADAKLSDNLTLEIEKAEQELKKIEDEKAELDYRVRNAKAGHVYIISNIGAFGDNVYKIGMTRRLNPDERIRELSAASVPFAFDVHAMIFSEDAPALESALHKTFHDKRVNKVNNRKEFFRVSLKEIEKVVRENYSKPIELTKLGIAKEYRETMMIEKEESKKYSSSFLTG